MMVVNRCCCLNFVVETFSKNNDTFRALLTSCPNGQPLANTERTNGQPLANTERTNGQPLANTERTNGQPLANTERTNGQPLANTERTNGQPLANTERTNGQPSLSLFSGRPNNKSCADDSLWATKIVIRVDVGGNKEYIQNKQTF